VQPNGSLHIIKFPNTDDAARIHVLHATGEDDATKLIETQERLANLRQPLAGRAYTDISDQELWTYAESLSQADRKFLTQHDLAGGIPGGRVILLPIPGTLVAQVAPCANENALVGRPAYIPFARNSFSAGILAVGLWGQAQRAQLKEKAERLIATHQTTPPSVKTSNSTWDFEAEALWWHRPEYRKHTTGPERLQALKQGKLIQDDPQAMYVIGARLAILSAILTNPQLQPTDAVDVESGRRMQVPPDYRVVNQVFAATLEEYRKSVFGLIQGMKSTDHAQPFLDWLNKR
jgi:hypothetical protein